MILSDKRILEEIEKDTIKLEPYNRECLGSNSYDVHLGKWLATYREHILDAKKHNEIEYFEIPDEGFVLYPHIFYLGATLNIQKHMPMYLFWKANLLPAAWVLIYMLLPARGMLVFVVTGRWKYLLSNRYVFTKACPLVN